MPDFQVARIQHRRGLQVDLPQPLRPGELGFCLDTGRLFMGGEEDTTPSGIQILIDQYSVAQSIIDNQILVVDTSNISNFDLLAFKSFVSNAANLSTAATQIAPTTVTLNDNQIQYDSENNLLYIGFTEDQTIATIASPGTNSGTISSSIDEITDGYYTDIASFSSQLTVNDISRFSSMIDENGGFATISHESANSISKIINYLSGVGLSSSKLNTEVLTEFSNINNNLIDQLLSPPRYSLPPSAVFVDFPGVGVEFITTESNIIKIDYSINLNTETNSATGSGEITLIVNESISSADVLFTCNFIQSPNNIDIDTGEVILLGSIEFFAVYLNPSTVKLQYKHNFPSTVVMRVVTKRWSSF